VSPFRRLLLIVTAFAPAAAFGSVAQAQAHDHSHDQAPSAAAAMPPVTAADRVLGRADAPVTIVEYASFTCSHCANWYNDVLPALRTRFIDTGRVKLVFRDLPTSPEQVSTAAAMIGRCAAPSKFFDVAASLFAGQASLSTGGGRAWFDNAIAASGRSRAEIEACFGEPSTHANLVTEVNAAVAAGVTGTPAFFVNGRRLTGDNGIEAMATAIAAATPRR
jgi:protein-disulfide isomerase